MALLGGYSGLSLVVGSIIIIVHVRAEHRWLVRRCEHRIIVLFRVYHLYNVMEQNEDFHVYFSRIPCPSVTSFADSTCGFAAWLLPLLWAMFDQKLS